MEIDGLVAEVCDIKSLDKIKFFAEIVNKYQLKFTYRLLDFLEEQLLSNFQDEKLLVAMNLVLCIFKKCLENSYTSTDWGNFSERIVTIVSTFFTCVLNYQGTPFINSNSFNELVNKAVVFFWSLGGHDELLKQSLLSGVSEQMLSIIACEHFNIFVRKCTLIKYVSNFLSESNKFRRTVIRSNINYVPVMLEWMVTCGDFEIQDKIVELCLNLSFLFKNKLNQLSFWLKNYPEIKDAVHRLDIRHYLTSSREFLNFVNSLECSKMQVLSIPCVKVHAGDTELHKPYDKLYTQFWVDFSIRTGNIHIIHAVSADQWSRVSVSHDNVKSITALSIHCGLNRGDSNCKELVIMLQNALPINLMPTGFMATNLKIVIQVDHSFYRVQQSFLKARYARVFKVMEIDHDDSEIIPVNAKMSAAVSSSKGHDERKRSLIDTTLSSIMSIESNKLKFLAEQNNELNRKNKKIYSSTPLKRPILSESKIKLPDKVDIGRSLNNVQEKQSNLNESQSKNNNFLKHSSWGTGDCRSGQNFFKMNPEGFPCRQENQHWKKDSDLFHGFKPNETKEKSKWNSFKDHPLYQSLRSTRSSFSDARMASKWLSLNNRARRLSCSLQSDNDSRSSTTNNSLAVLSLPLRAPLAQLTNTYKNKTLVPNDSDSSNKKITGEQSDVEYSTNNKGRFENANDSETSLTRASKCETTKRNKTGVSAFLQKPRFTLSQGLAGNDILNRKSSESQKDDEILNNSQTPKAGKKELNLFKLTIDSKQGPSLFFSSLIDSSENVPASREGEKNKEIEAKERPENYDVENRRSGMLTGNSHQELSYVGSAKNVSQTITESKHEKSLHTDSPEVIVLDSDGVKQPEFLLKPKTDRKEMKCHPEGLPEPQLRSQEASREVPHTNLSGHTDVPNALRAFGEPNTSSHEQSPLDRLNSFERLLPQNKDNPRLSCLQKPLRTYNKKTNNSKRKSNLKETLNSLISNAPKKTSEEYHFKEVFGSSGKKRKLYNPTEYVKTPSEDSHRSSTTKNCKLRENRSIYSDLENENRRFFQKRDFSEKVVMLFSDLTSESDSRASKVKKTQPKTIKNDKNVKKKMVPPSTSRTLRSGNRKNYRELSSEGSLSSEVIKEKEMKTKIKKKRDSEKITDSRVDCLKRNLAQEKNEISEDRARKDRMKAINPNADVCRWSLENSNKKSEDRTKKENEKLINERVECLMRSMVNEGNESGEDRLRKKREETINRRVDCLMRSLDEEEEECEVRAKKERQKAVTPPKRGWQEGVVETGSERTMEKSDKMISRRVNCLDEVNTEDEEDIPLGIRLSALNEKEEEAARLKGQLGATSLQAEQQSLLRIASRPLCVSLSTSIPAPTSSQVTKKNCDLRESEINLDRLTDNNKKSLLKEVRPNPSNSSIEQTKINSSGKNIERLVVKLKSTLTNKEKELSDCITTLQSLHSSLIDWKKELDST